MSEPSTSESSMSEPGTSEPGRGGPAPFPTVGLLGLGSMGAGIAQVFAASGRHVVVLETDRARLDAGLAAVAASFDAELSQGRATDRSATPGRITGTLAVADLAGADLVLESATEDAEPKKALLARVAAVVGERTPIVTSTSDLSVTDLAAGLPHPARVAGLHFFHPAPRTHTVEVVRALQTGEETLEQLAALVDTLPGKNPVVVDDRPGFLVNALLLPYLNDVIQEYDDGLATAEDIDTALRLGLGHKAGPFEMLDLIGLDVHLRATEAVHAATLDQRYAPPPLLRRMVAAGRLGAKNGLGFRTGASSPTHPSRPDH